MTETLEQITERATREAEAKITYEPPAPSFSNALTDNHLLALAKEAEKTGYIAGVIAEATRDRWISVEDQLPEEDKNELSSMVLCQTHKEGMAVLCYSYRYNSWQAWNGDEWPDATHWMYLPTSPTT